MRKIKVVVKRPGEPTRSTNISDSLKNLQNTVGGHIETVTITSDTVVIVTRKGGLRICRITAIYAELILSEQ